MKYIALLRGINVSGNTLIKMDALKEVVASCGFTDVITYIQSGNVIFTAKEGKKAVTEKLEAAFLHSFMHPIPTVVSSLDEFRKILADVPKEWIREDNLRRYIAFVRAPVTVQNVLPHVEPKPGVDFVQAGPNVLYLTTTLSGLTKSGFTKLITKKIYQSMTMRNYTTVLKLKMLAEKM